MTTDNEKSACRPIEDLLKLDSYQDMNDEEIQLVINHNANIAAIHARANAMAEQDREKTNAIIQELKERNRILRDEMEKISQPVLYVINPTQIEDDLQ